MVVGALVRWSGGQRGDTRSAYGRNGVVAADEPVAGFLVCSLGSAGRESGHQRLRIANDSFYLLPIAVCVPTQHDVKRLLPKPH